MGIHFTPFPNSIMTSFLHWGSTSALLGQDPINAHPLRNDMTTAVASSDLVRFLEAESHPPLILDFDDLGADLSAAAKTAI